MKNTKCFECDLSRCKDCEYHLSDEGYAYSKKTRFKRANEAWNYYHPDDLMPQKGFVAHHDSKNRLDDSKENIKKWTDFEHRQYHGSHCSEETIEKNRQASLGNQYALNCKHSKEQNARKSEAMKENQNAKGCKFPPRTEEHRAKISKRMKGKQYALGCKHPPRSEESKEKYRVATKKYWEEVRSGERKR